MKNKFNLTDEQKKVLEEIKKPKKKNFNCSYCSDCFYCSCCSNQENKKYMIKNVQFTKEEYIAWKKNLI